MRALDDIVQEGKARYIGVSNFRLAQIEACMRLRPIDVVQYGWNMFDRRMQREIFPYCQEHGMTLSRLVNDFLLALPDTYERDPFKSPIVERLMYASAFGPFEGDTYRDYLYRRREHITKRFEDDAYLEG